MKRLILQVLGTSDILVDGKEGYKQLQESYNLNDIERKATENDKTLIENLNRVDFPLIQKLSDNQPSNTIFACILTTQVRWVKKHNNSVEYWNEYVASDGIWWQHILSEWCKQQNLNHYPIFLDVPPEIPYGAADWEGMAELIDSLLDKYFSFNDKNLIYFQPQESEKIQIDTILVQHSSGTPALSSALYLWGVEKKLTAGDKIEFVYLSEQEAGCPTHSGKHWQWRLKDPQIRELLKIQDFSGALILLDSYHPNYESLKKNLEFLDKSVSLNLEGRSLQGRDNIIERVSIALWSEKAFRDRSQWMHWYLRIAGAFELALLLLVEKQGNGNYEWKEHKLIFKQTANNNDVGKNCSISDIVKELLMQGNWKGFAVNPVTDNQWQKFKRIYVDNWKLGEQAQENLGFITVRNRLYHSLIGDSIDQLLDKKTQELNNVTHPDHPSQIAVDWLNYIVKLAGVFEEVDKKVKEYCTCVSEIIARL